MSSHHHRRPEPFGDEPDRSQPRSLPGRRGVARRIVRTEILEVLTEALGLDPEPGSRDPVPAGGGVRRGLRAAVARVLGSIAAAGRGPERLPAALPPPEEPPPPGPPPEPAAGFAERSQHLLLEAEARLDALSGRVERVRRALAEQRELLREPPTPETAREVLLAAGELAESMRRVAEEMRRERERMVHQILELTEALRSVHRQLQGLQALPAGVPPAPAPSDGPPEPQASGAEAPRPPAAGGPPEPSSLLLPPVVVLTVTSLEGFDRVLLLRAALLQRPQVQAASVLRYAEGEAELHLVLDQPEPPAAVAGLVAAALGRPVRIRSVDLAAGTVRADAGRG